MGDLLAVERDEACGCGRRSQTICRASTAATSARSRCLACGWSPHRARRPGHRHREAGYNPVGGR